MSIIERLERKQLMVAVRTQTPEQAFMAAEACIKGGVGFVEITFSVPGAEEVIKKLSASKNASVGAGTVLSIADAKKALRAGASYVVSPNVDEKIIKFIKKEGAVSIPGASTPSEIYRAYKAGGDIIKLFSFVEMGGLDFLKSIRGPFPFIKYLLSGGVNLDNIYRYIEARAAGILIGSAIIKREFIMAGDWQSITNLSKMFVRKTDEELSKREDNL